MPTPTVFQTTDCSIFGKCAPACTLKTCAAFPGEKVIPQAMKTRQVSLRDMVVTPDRVPKFTIPAPAPSRRTRAQNPGQLSESRWSPDISRRHTMACLPRCPLSYQVWHRGPESELKFWGEVAREDLSDPVSRAAMSIPHLLKVTTPYGFLTLGESPSVRRRESVFFRDEIPRLYNSGTGDEHVTRYTTSPSQIAQMQADPHSGLEKFPRTVRTLRSFSCDTSPSYSCDSYQSETYPHSLQTSLDSRLSVSPTSASRGRGKLHQLLKKRLAALRTLKLCRCLRKRHSTDCILTKKNSMPR